MITDNVLTQSNTDLNLLLNAAETHGIIDIVDICEQIEALKRKEILEKHKTEYWQGKGKESFWYWRNPDKDVNPNRSRIKRKNQKDIEDIVFDYYSKLEKERKEQISLDDMPFEELFYEMLEDKKSKRATSTIKKNINDWRKFIEPHTWFIEKPFKDITKIDVDKLFNSIVRSHSLCSKNFGNIAGLIKQSFEYAIDAEYVEKTPYRVRVNKKLILKKRKKNSEFEIFYPDEQKLLIEEQERRLKNNPSNTANLAIMLCFEIGVRKGEMMALRDSDIDYENKTIEISRQSIEIHEISDSNNVKLTGFEIANYTKSESSNRIIPLTPKALEIIERVKKINKKYHKPFEDYLFIRNGFVICPNIIDSQLKLSCGYLGIRVRKMHKIRKTYASTLYKNGVDVLTISKMLGHSDIKTTVDNYIYELEEKSVIYENVVNALQKAV